LTPGWETGEENARWASLRKERDRILAIRASLAPLSTGTVARVDRRLSEAIEIIDTNNSSKVSLAVLRLSQAEFEMHRAWRSRQLNRWIGRERWYGPMWLWIALALLLELGVAAGAIFWGKYFPQGGDVPFSDVFFGASLWGFAGATVAALRTLHHRIERQEFETGQIAWYFISPIIGLAFGSIAFLLFLIGALTVGLENAQPGTVNVGGLVRAASSVSDSSVGLDGWATQSQSSQFQVTPEPSPLQDINPTPILLLALLAGFAQNAFIGSLQQIINARFRGDGEE
jgi:hypothetical protein